MPLESCMLVLDNSEYMRNGDYQPTRFQAQAQAVNTIFAAKTDANPESAVGLMTMAGNAPQLLVTPTNDLGRLIHSLSKSTIGGTSDLVTAIQIAQLALKNRENKNQRQRIVVFVGSPVEETKDALDKLGKRLRKNNVFIDVVVFGDEAMECEEKIGAVVEGAGGGESHLVTVPPGATILSDVIAGSPILYDPDRPQRAAAGGDEGMGEEEFDPNMDPELAMALRMSLQEEQERLRRLGLNDNPPAEASGSGSAVPPPASNISEPSVAEPVGGSSATLPASMTQPLSNAKDRAIPAVPGDASAGLDAQETDALLGEDDEGDDEDEDEDDEEEMLRRAMALSRGENPEDDVVMAEGEGDDDDEEDEEAAMARAIAMSLEEAKDRDGDSKK